MARLQGKGIGTTDLFASDPVASAGSVCAVCGPMAIRSIVSIVDGNYEPGNCRWATWKEQQNNRRNNRWLVIGGERMTMMEAAHKFGLNYYTLRSRIYILKMPAEKAIGFTRKAVQYEY